MSPGRRLAASSACNEASQVAGVRNRGHERAAATHQRRACGDIVTSSAATHARAAPTTPAVTMGCCCRRGLVAAATIASTTSVASPVNRSMSDRSSRATAGPRLATQHNDACHVAADHARRKVAEELADEIQAHQHQSRQVVAALAQDQAPLEHADPVDRERQREQSRQRAWGDAPQAAPAPVRRCPSRRAPLPAGRPQAPDAGTTSQRRRGRRAAGAGVCSSAMRVSDIAPMLSFAFSCRSRVPDKSRMSKRMQG
jgi:hypothetical protein